MITYATKEFYMDLPWSSFDEGWTHCRTFYTRELFAPNIWWIFRKINSKTFKIVLNHFENIPLFCEMKYTRWPTKACISWNYSFVKSFVERMDFVMRRVLFSIILLKTHCEIIDTKKLLIVSATIFCSLTVTFWPFLFVKEINSFSWCNAVWKMDWALSSFQIKHITELFWCCSLL